MKPLDLRDRLESGWIDFKAWCWDARLAAVDIFCQFRDHFFSRKK